MGNGKKKILLIEDDQMIGSMYKTKFEQKDLIVILADNGARGLELAISEKPNLVILDIILPELDGFSVLQELRANESTRNTPIIMLTNLGTDEDKAKGKKYGATDYLVKASLTPAEVSEKIARYL